MINQEDDYYGEDVYGFPSQVPQDNQIAITAPPAGPAAPPANNTAPTGPPTRKLGPNERPPSPNPNAVWNDDWWDGRSDYIGGWLIPNSTTFGPSGPGGPTGPAPAAPAVGGETATAFDWPGYQSAGPFQPRDDTFDYTPFNYDPYTASSWEDAEKEPGYGASRNQLKKQIEAGAAYKGMLRSGMTIGDLYSGLDSLAQQNFSNFDNRRFRNYSENRNNAFGAWQGNLNAAAQKFALELGADKDVYDRKATDLDRGNNYRFNVASSQFQDMLSRWQERVRSLTNIATAGANT